jgi:hypothetical protein
METLVQQKILNSFVNEVSAESPTIQPINVDVKKFSSKNMSTYKTMVTRDNNYFIKYGGMPLDNAYRGIEVYTTNTLISGNPLYSFNDIKVNNIPISLVDLKQGEDGRFYAVANTTYEASLSAPLFIIFNNFIQEGHLKINKYYTPYSMGLTDSIWYFYNVAKVENSGVYFIYTGEKIIKFQISVLDGNKASIVNVIDTTQGVFKSELNIIGEKVILTKLWKNEIEYAKAIFNVNDELTEDISLNTIVNVPVTSEGTIPSIVLTPFSCVIPELISNRIQLSEIDLNGNVTRYSTTRRFYQNLDIYVYVNNDFVSVNYQNNLYLYFKKDNELIEYYVGTLNGILEECQILNNYNMQTIIGISVDSSSNESIVSIKNICSPNVTSEPYFDYDFCLPYYMNLYSNSNDNTSLIFSRDATARFYFGNQITSTFILPNYLLNDGNIEKASVYGKTNYLLNSKIENFEKNKFESLYFNFIYNLNVIDNTNGLNTLNQIGSNKVANGLWKTFDNYDLRLTKARITYKDSSTEIINLNIPTVTGNSVTFNFEVSGNVTKIEYLSNDESTVYATFRTNLTGTNTITQTIKVE